MLSAAKPLEGLRALVVEDEILLAEELRERLVRLGMREVRLVDTGEGAIETSLSYQPHIILMDIRLKGRMDGIDAAIVIRGQLEAPVVFLTAHSDQETLHRAMKSDPFGYVLKPLNERELVVAIEMTLHRFELERRLRESEYRYAATLASIGDGVIVTDMTGHVTFMNAVAEKLTGWQRDLARGRTAGEVMQVVAEATGTMCEATVDRALRTGDTVHFAEPSLLVARNGTQIPIDDSAAPVIGDRGERMGAVVAFRDISARRQTEKALDEATSQLRQAQRLEAIGRLAGGVAHDFNNLLTVINGSADLALDESGLDASTRHLLGVIRNTGDRAAHLTRQLLTFGRRDSLHVSTIQMGELMDQVAVLLAQVLTPLVRFVVTVDPGLWPIQGDPGKVEQIIMNLCINARDAMPEGGRLSLSLENTEVAPGGVAVVPGIQPGPFVLMTVADTGCGMDQEVRHRLFEPFFTTKGQGQGTGLGLATVYGIVGQMNGFITVASEPGQGSTFRVYLPGHPGTVASPPEPRALPAVDAPSGGHETVLVVDDDISIRSLIATALERQGYTVVEAASGEDALRTIARSDRPFHLLLTDQHLPGMGGKALIALVRAAVPGIRVLLTSGVADEKSHAEIAGNGTVTFMQKPFKMSLLTNMVRATLDG